MGPSASLDGREKFAHTENRSPDRTACSELLCRLGYRGPYTSLRNTCNTLYVIRHYNNEAWNYCKYHSELLSISQAKHVALPSLRTVR